MTTKPPKCPSCSWYLKFEAVDYSWVGSCWNPLCDVDVVPPTINQELINYIRGMGQVYATDVASRFEWTVQNANNHLTTLYRLNLLKRQRVNPVRGGKRFVWMVA